MSNLSELLYTWPEEYEVLVSVQSDGRFAAVLYRNSSEHTREFGTSVIEAVINLEAALEAA